MRRAALLASLLALAGCGMSDAATMRLARTSPIDPRAPLQVTLAVDIDADPARVLAILTAIDAWPRRFRAVGKAHLDGPARPGAHFTWRTGGIRIRSVLARADAGGVAWIGHAWGLTAIHVWRLTPRGAHGTHVEMAESLAGLPASLFMSASALRNGDAAWLADLRRAATGAG